MEIVELRVQVEDSQLKKLQADVQALKGTTINLGTGAGGSGGGKGSDPTAGVRAGLKATEQQATKTGQSILSVVGKVAKWTAVTTAVYAPIKAFKEAITTIKALDTEMVNIQKVTGATSKQMQQYQQQAYALASEYGRSATDVAESMTAFARAGYGEQLTQMAELSTLLQNVGYVSADTANSMLLAVDAAWHLNGSQKELMAVLDGVDKITNQNATDFDKMATGMTVAASVFSESGESIQTFASMIGTGTAVTQRSGQEIARGLRTVLMNIRQIKGETEDGELIDGESIAKASAALKEFAGISTMENGELRKASDVLADLAHKWEDLDSVQQSAIAEALAGKRQANILTALMGNWDMYEKQMEEYATAAGTALKENEIYMDSWAAKSEQLKAKWTEFVSGFVNTDVIKGSLDGIISALNFLDSGVGHAALGIAALTASFAGIAKLIPVITGSKLVTFFTDFAAASKAAAAGSEAAASAMSMMKGDIISAITPFLAFVALAADFKFMADAIDEAFVSFDEQTEKVASLKSEYEQLTGAGSEYAQLMAKVGTGDLTQADRNRLTILNAQADALERQIQLEQDLAFQKFQQKEAGTYQLERGKMVDTGVGQKGDEKRLEKMNKLYEEGFKKVQEGEASLQDYRATLQDIIADNTDWYNQMKEWENLGYGDSFSDAQKEAMALYETISMLLGLGDKDLPIVKALNDFEQRGKGIAEFGNNLAVNAEQIRSYFKSIGLGAEEAQEAIDGLRADGVIVIDVEHDDIETTISQLGDLGIAVEEAGEWKINVDALKEFANQVGLSADETDKLAAALDSVDGVSLIDAEGNAVSLLDTMTELGTKSPMELLVSANTGDADASIAGTQQKADDLENSDPNVDVSATDNASGTILTATAEARAFGDMRPSPTLSAKDNATSVINGAISALGRFRDKTITITTKYVTSGTGPGGGGWGSGSAGFGGKATGDINFKGGPVLLGDEYSPTGAPRPELVITRDGKAFLAGVTGPVATTLPAGSRIFKYSDTLDVLSGKDMEQIAAYAGGGGNGAGGLSLGERYVRGANGGGDASGGGGGGGNANNAKANANNANANKGNANANKAKGGGGGGGRKKGGGGGGGSSSSAKSEEDEYRKQLEKELELLEAQYEFLEASNASTGELRDKSTEIQAKLHEINEYLATTDAEQKDLVDNSTKWWQENEKQKGLLENQLSLLRAEYELLEASGAGAEDLNKKSQEIQDKLHEINETIRSVNGSQEEIAENSTAWWEELKKIQDVQIGVYERERDLLETEAELMSHDGTSPAERLSKMREIQDNLHQQAEYMRSIKASQADINRLSIQWWEVQKDILSVQQSLVDELNAAVDEKLRLARKERDAELEIIDKQIDQLQKERDIQEEQLSIEEKRKAVEEARFALENAQRQRTVRYFNASTGQWEWGADARNVASARKAYDQAQKDIDKDNKDREYNLRIEALELQKEEINSRYDALATRWEALTDSFKEPLRDIEDILRDLLATGTLTESQVAMVKELCGDIDEYTLSILSALLTFKEFQSIQPDTTGVEYVKYVMDWLDKNGWTQANTDQAKSMVQASGSAAAAAIFAAEQAAQAAGTTTRTSSTPYGNVSSGATSAAVAAVKAATSSSSSGSSSKSSGASSAASSAAKAASSGSSSKSSSSSTKSTLSSTGASSAALAAVKAAAAAAGKTYDSGGVLSGFGGIKATGEDEIVIPPELAGFMLKPSANHQFKQRMAELGYLYGTGSLSATNLVGTTRNNASNDHYGDVYNYGNITLSESQARSMTVYELAQKSRGLSVYSAIG